MITELATKISSVLFHKRHCLLLLTRLLKWRTKLAECPHRFSIIRLKPFRVYKIIRRIRPSLAWCGYEFIIKNCANVFLITTKQFVSNKSQKILLQYAEIIVIKNKVLDNDCKLNFSFFLYLHERKKRYLHVYSNTVCRK